MALVAVSAGVIAIYRTMAGPGWEVVRPALMIPLISVMSMTPVRYAQPKRWVVIATWIIAFWPLSIIVSLHVAFAVDSVLDRSQPNSLGLSPVVRLFLGQCLLWSGISSVIMTLIGFYLPLIAPDRSEPGSRRWNPQLVPGLMMTPIWLTVIGILSWDPTGAFAWFVD